MATNDISVRPSKQQILIGDFQVVYYGSSLPEYPFNRIRRTQAVVLRSPTTSVVCLETFMNLAYHKKLLKVTAHFPLKPIQMPASTPSFPSFGPSPS